MIILLILTSLFLLFAIFIFVESYRQKKMKPAAKYERTTPRKYTMKTGTYGKKYFKNETV